jgi:hypothetical protein
MKTKLEIKNRFTGKIIFEFETENNSIKKTVCEYIRQELNSGKYYANLTDADLTDADLTDADLTRANLTHANLTDADLTHADLLQFKSDLWRVLLMYKNEIGGLKQSILDGKINGSQYTGTCACLKGTIANVKGCHIDLLSNITKSVSEPSEQWFLQFREGHTPTNNNALKLTYEWIEGFESFLIA